MASKRIEWLDSLRGFAMLLVVLGHVSAMSSDLVLWIYSFHMPLFFIISGVVFRYSKYTSLKECMLDKTKKLLLPYVFLFAINIPFWYINWKVLGNSSATPIGMLEGFLAANHALGYMTSTVLWFLPCLFLVSVLFWGLVHLDATKNVRLEGTIILCFLAAWFLTSFSESPAVWHWKTVPVATVFYWMGYQFGRVWKQFESRLDGIGGPEYGAVYPLIAIGFLALGTMAAFVNGKISMHMNSYNNMTLMLASSFALSLGFAMLFIKLPKIWLFDYAGKNSITFFGFHIALLRFFEHFPYTADFAEGHPLWLGLAVFVLLVPISMFVNRWCPFIVGKKRGQAKAGRTE